MNKNEKPVDTAGLPTDTFSADVLVVGGSIAGLTAALKIKEINPSLDVIVVDKATVGTSGGKANKGAGVLWVMAPEDSIDKFREYHVDVIGKGLNDQDLLEKIAEGTREGAKHLEKWGVTIMREADGSLARIKEFPLWALCAVDLDLMDKLRAAAIKAGVKTVDKTQIVELLTDGKKIAGATGFSILEGTFRVFSAKAVVLATGSCDWMVTNMWSSARGDGIAAAVRAGAELRNAEFANFYNIGLRGNHSCQVGAQYALYNDNGERLAPKYCAEWEPDIDIGILRGMEREVAEGRGPIRFEETELFIQNPLACGGFLFRWDRPWANRFWRTMMGKEEECTVDHDPRPEVVPNFLGEFSALKVDHGFRTTIEGLFAAGDTCYTGSAWAGAVPAPPGKIRGSGLMFAVVSALIGAPEAANYAGAAKAPNVSQEQVAKQRSYIYAPMEKVQGRHPRELIFALKETVAPPYYSVSKRADRLAEALARVKDIQEQAMGNMSAQGDWHFLGLCHDLLNMALCAEFYFTCAAQRTESRGYHYRLDHPQRDDGKWLKWIVSKLEDGKPKLWTENIPVDSYKTKVKP